MQGFEYALAALKEGRTVRRKGWNGKGMFLRVLQGIPVKVRDPIPPVYGMSDALPDDAFLHVRTVQYAGHIAMWTATGEYVPWLASVTDLMAEDWEVVDLSHKRLTESQPA